MEIYVIYYRKTEQEDWKLFVDERNIPTLHLTKETARAFCLGAISEFQFGWYPVIIPQLAKEQVN